MPPRDDAGNRQVDRSDQLSPSRALEESLGASRSQRVGDNTPVANPIVSFPGEPGGENPSG